jgi:hypothetical protein
MDRVPDHYGSIGVMAQLRGQPDPLVCLAMSVVVIKCHYVFEYPSQIEEIQL